MPFGCLAVHFVVKHRRVCRNLRRGARKPTEDCTSSVLTSSVPVPLEHIAPSFGGAVANVKRFARIAT